MKTDRLEEFMKSKSRSVRSVRTFGQSLGTHFKVKTEIKKL